MFIEELIRKPLYEVAIVIPIYKTQLSAHERISLERCLTILGNYKIIVLAPEGLAIENIPLLRDVKFDDERFQQYHFTDVGSYSRLLLSCEFYRRFLKFQYILIYQLDAFVFSDQLEAWCQMSYDYIGAPWINADWVNYPDWAQYFRRPLLDKLGYLPGSKSRMVGNGGFSLRKVRTFLFALLLLKHKALKWGKNEDIFWSFEVPKYFPFFRIPDEKLAMQFSIETEPRVCLRANQNILPFGCHAWERYDFEFWRSIFNNFGYTI